MYLNTLTGSECSDRIYTMIIGFLIATLIIFIINLSLSLVVIALSVQIGNITLIHLISVVVSLVMISWNILAIASL
jgi:hypothetical protein